MAGTQLTVTGTDLTIGDDDTESTSVTLSVSPTSVAEDALPAAREVTVTATLNADSRVGSTAVTVSLGETGDTATEGTDYTAVADFTVTIPAGATDGTATFTLTPTNDGLAEGDETLSVSGSTTAATMAGKQLTVTGTDLTIGDDDTESTEVTLSVSPDPVQENAGATTVTVTATLNEDAFPTSDSKVVTVSVGETDDTATEGTDYTAVPDVPGGDPRRRDERYPDVHADDPRGLDERYRDVHADADGRRLCRGGTRRCRCRARRRG